MQTTCAKLVNDAMSGDRVAMAALDRQYRAWLEDWAKNRYSLQQADAEDLVSELLKRIYFSLKTFTYDPKKSFRGWLQTALKNEFLKSIRSPQAVQITDSVVQRLHNDEVEYGELEKLILKEAMTLQIEVWLPAARERCKHPMHWRAYELLAIQGKPLPEAAKELGAKRVTVSTWAYRFQQVYLKVVYDQYRDMCDFDEATA